MSNRIFLSLSGDEKQISRFVDELPGGPHGEVQFFGGWMGFRVVEREDDIIEFEADDFNLTGGKSPSFRWGMKAVLEYSPGII